MARSPRPQIIDDYDDLYRAAQVREIVAQAPEFGNHPGAEERYFNSKFEFAKEFARKLNLVPFRIFNQPEFAVNLTESLVNNSHKAFMAPQDSLIYYQHHVSDDNITKNLHVSASGGNAQPYYLVKTFLAQEDKYKALDFV